MSGDESAPRNQFGGQAENVVQASHIQGGVHFHSRAEKRAEPPRLIPAPTPHFINQHRVLAQADAAFAGIGAGPRILVFGGPPGVGKREVARYWLQRHADEFPDGQFHADLSAGLEERGLESTRLREFLLAAGVDGAAIPDTAEGRAACFRSWSNGRRVVVAVDKALTPRQVRMLCPGPGRSVVLVTAAGSLTGLGVRDSVTFIDLSPLEDDAAVELLRRFVGAGRADAEPDAVSALAGICAGLPIGLCVAGAMLAARPNRRIERLVADLVDERRRLAGLSRIDDLSVTAVFNTAYRRLSPEARRCYRAFGVHPGEGDVAVEVLVAAVRLAGSEISDAVEELVDARLLTETGTDRYRLHTLLRLHAKAIADEPGEMGDSREVFGRMLEHYRDGAVAAGHAALPLRGWLDVFYGTELAATTGVAEPMRWLEAERENLLAVLDELFAQRRLDEVCLLAVALWPLHERGKYHDDLASVNERAVEAATLLRRPDLCALLTTQLGFAQLFRRQAREALDTFGSAASAAAATGVVELEATALESMGLATLALGDEAAAEDLLRRTLALAEGIGEPRRLALARLHLAKAVAPQVALPLLDAAFDGFRALGPAEETNTAKVRLWRGRALTRSGRFAEAGRELDAALTVMGAQGRVFDQAEVLEAAGDLAGDRGEPGAAAERYRESLAITETGGFTADAERVRGKLSALSDVDDVLGSTEPQ